MPSNTRDLRRLISRSDVAAVAAAQAELGASLRQFTEVLLLQTSRIMEQAAQVSHATETAAQLSRFQEEVVDSLAPITHLQEQIADAFTPTSAFQQDLDRLLEPSAKRFADLVQTLQFSRGEMTRLDEVLATMSRLAAPEIDRLVGSQLEEWREAGVWAPDLEGQTDEGRAKPELDEGADRFAVLHDSLTHAIVEQSKLTADTEVQLVSLLALVALATGNWVLALFFALDLLRQAELARRPATVSLRESMRDWDVILEWDEEGDAWVTFVPALNNISTFGSTREEALERTHEAIRGYLKTAAKRGIPIPEEKPREQPSVLSGWTTKSV